MAELKRCRENVNLIREMRLDVLPISGIYGIRCRVNGRSYVGSSGNIRKRCLSHLRRLRGKKHENMFLQLAWDKHGEDVFEFISLEQVERDLLFDREEFWIQELSAHKDKGGYNILPHAGTVRGMDSSLRVILAPHREAMTEGIRRYWEQASNDERRRRRAMTQQSNAKSFVICHPDGSEENIFCLKEFCEQMCLSYNAMKKVARYQARAHRGYHVRLACETLEDWQKTHFEVTRKLNNAERYKRHLKLEGRQRQVVIWVLQKAGVEVARFTTKEELAMHVGASPAAVKAAKRRNRPISRGPLKGYTIK